MYRAPAVDIAIPDASDERGEVGAPGADTDGRRLGGALVADVDVVTARRHPIPGVGAEGDVTAASVSTEVGGGADGGVGVATGVVLQRLKPRGGVVRAR